jgi:hypothetical protein
MIPAVVGAEQEVPDTDCAVPPATMTNLVAWAEMSGYARPELLSYLVTVVCVVSVVNHSETAASWYDGRANISEKPPPPLDHAASGEIPVVPPTVVSQGQAAGKAVVNWALPATLQVEPTPESPKETRIETPRAPSWEKRLQALVA